MATKESEQGREIMCDDVKDRSEPSRAAQLKYVIEKARVEYLASFDRAYILKVVVE
jgi:hypothetical protein